MNKSSCFELGYILKPFGTNGELVAVLDTETPETYLKLKHIFIEQKNTLLPYAVEKAKMHKEQLLLKLEDVNTETVALSLKGAAIFLPLRSLPQLADDEYYLHDLVGMQVEDLNLGFIGQVESIYEAPQYNILAVNHKGHEILIPINNVFVPHIDLATKHIRTNLPEGFIEVYTGGDDTERDD
ncbi:MAG: 16S rRNA processing protein RimM [Cytophagales bacterium]|nr:MAG: 16S rRNA processing protein RimM [Cytophagales bacterium]TAF61078.1 MAG: 16S rRNA processing protein RimM [Cytophagales bacterium]